MALTLDTITALLAEQGSAQYGQEAVSQLEHALQCAHLAEQAGETPETITASLLHDLGHLLATERDGPMEVNPDKDDLHQYLALPFLRSVFPEAVLAPILLHVDAKRYLCLIDPAYWEGLSPASRHSLELQGGVFAEDEAEAFIAQPYAMEAVRLRRYDDLAKVPGKAVPGLNHFAPYLAQTAL